MTTAQMGRRMGVSQSQVVQMEQREHAATLTLSTLERAADALGCRLVYALVPLEPLESMIEQRAQSLAQKQLGYAAHTMELENQALSDEDARNQLKELRDALVVKSGSELWKEA